jgi:hypothetical protein
MGPARPSIQTADVLVDRLPPALDAMSTRRYGGPISLRRVAAGDAFPASVRFRLGRPGGRSLEAAFTIRHVGGNVYDIQGRVDDRPPRSFCYCLPEPAPLLVPEAPRLAGEVAAFLLDALERRVGRDHLRRTVRRGAAVERPSASSSRPRDSGTGP